MKGKRIFSILFLVFVFFFGGREALAVPVYDNPWQGIFQCHATNSIGSDYLKGGSVIVRWDWLQPTDNNSLDQTQLNNLFTLIRTAGKKQYLHFQTFGPTGCDKPQCDYDGPPRDGNCCDHKTLPDWMNAYDGNPANDPISIMTDGVFGTNPVVWDTRYQDKLKIFLNLLNQALIQNSLIEKIEFIEPAIGPWNSTGLWLRDKNGQADYDNLNLWSEAAGCPEISPPSTDFSCMGRVRTAGINKVMDIFHEIFTETPMTLVNESCRFESCAYGGVDYLLDTYGMKTFFKQAGLGSPYDGNCGRRDIVFGSLCGSSARMTRCSHETNGVSIDAGGTNFPDGVNGCNGYFETYKSVLWRGRTSYYCMYSDDITYGGNQTTNKFVAEHAGAQISIASSSINATTKNAGEPLTININWHNQGSTSLIGPKIQEKKWIPSSYKLFLEFVKNGEISSYREYDLSPGTNTWDTTKLEGSFSTSTTINLPRELGGEASTSQTVYRIYFGLADPNGDKTRFGFINDDSKYDFQNKRYLLIDNFTVVGQKSDPSPPDSVPTQNPSCACPAGVPVKYLGNANCDSRIDGIDFEIWREEKNGLKTTRTADFNCVNGVTDADFEIWRQNRSR